MPISDPADIEGTSLIDVFAIGGISVPVFAVDGMMEKESLLGENHSIPYQHIRVDSGLSDQGAAQTILHELLHVISDMYGLGLREAQVRVLEQVWTQLAQDSPRSLERLFSALRTVHVPPKVLTALATAASGVMDPQAPSGPPFDPTLN